MRKALYTASTDNHIINFHIPYINWLKKQGFEVHVACSGEKEIEHADRVFRIPFKRSPFDAGNVKAYKELKNLIQEHKYSLIHCHTPACSVITRLAALDARKKYGAKVLYTAHGFHFYRGSPKLNWLTFYPVEVLLSRVTDAIITMNDEDYATLNDRVFSCKGKYQIDGIGINPSRLQFDQYDRELVRKELNITDSSVVVLYIAEFNKRKNHQFIFRNIPSIIQENPNLLFIFLGSDGTERIHMEKLARQLNIQDHIRFMGYQKEIGKFVKIADIGISSSRAEGLPIGIAEIMYSGLPVVVSDIRGHKELVKNGSSGFLFDLTDDNAFVSAVSKLGSDSARRIQIGIEAKRSMSKFLVDNPLAQMSKIYKNYI